jgi:hypothetical protein
MGSVPVRRRKRASLTGGPQTFRSPTAVIIWWVWVLFALANLIDLAVQGRDHGSVVAAAILLLVTGVAYIGGQRPRLIADQAGLTVRNPLRDHHVGWANVIKVDLYDLLRVHCDQGQAKPAVINAWAVHYSRRRKVASELKVSRQSGRRTPGRSSGLPGLGGSFGGGRTSGYEPPAAGTGSVAEAEAERIVSVLQEYVTAAHAEVVWADGTAPAPAEPGPQGGSSGPTGPSGHTGLSGQAGPSGPPGRAGEAGRAAGDAAAGPDAAADPRLAGWREPLRTAWSRPAILAVAVPAVLLLIVSLV